MYKKGRKEGRLHTQQNVFKVLFGRLSSSMKDPTDKQLDQGVQAERSVHFLFAADPSRKIDWHFDGDFLKTYN